MSQDYKLKYDDMLDNNPGRQGQGDRTFATNGHVRNISFEWPDGSRKFRNYAYLIGSDYHEATDELWLIFTSDIFVLKGTGLTKLYEEILVHSPQKITCISSRYLALETSPMVVTDILVLEKR